MLYSLEGELSTKIRVWKEGSISWKKMNIEVERKRTGGTGVGQTTMNYPYKILIKSYVLR